MGLAIEQVDPQLEVLCKTLEAKVNALHAKLPAAHEDQKKHITNITPRSAQRYDSHPKRRAPSPQSSTSRVTSLMSAKASSSTGMSSSSQTRYKFLQVQAP
jgi:hypothetical protein